MNISEQVDLFPARPRALGLSVALQELKSQRLQSLGREPWRRRWAFAFARAVCDAYGIPGKPVLRFAVQALTLLKQRACTPEELEEVVRFALNHLKRRQTPKSLFFFAGAGQWVEFQRGNALRSAAADARLRERLGRRRERESARPRRSDPASRDMAEYARLQARAAPPTPIGDVLADLARRFGMVWA